MDQKLIAHLTSTISLLADDRQYILVIKSNPTQSIKNGYHTYHRAIGDCFEEILSHMIRLNIADGKDKEMKDIAIIVENTAQKIRKLFKSFEDLVIDKKG
ncbi:hypothetical protein A2W67_01110 [Candidatus Nomurabacteria bacterium RIFCSPLOWO2_02_40_28]|uniref:Uncharacterized protein n=2 Tax=Candidatus Nomuraibacteriota TaxID=1752729 RepID=A0A837HWF4_9BACT|nr:MAG: hypothetical protein UT27_C0001G0049 [Candidatus Nomurabacteria bacterium GW2011_GWD2_39_12]KKR20684.1 MAG: hypothetical protein UT51_C0002G0119 [Candidatus Nomurabacteria bacterium GW2011_GWC2_39_41]KKR37387.1 MAG: hypothetical protein UT70_C0001G0063 [Candidatus Nomurabacteria bacterium GW2011_GWE2_40_10]KKR38635.1 MAG: hypothetical protein UT73_C0002G0120 [Candidatus Nomurabacteria bacterium GW2011_GWB1_40_11]KKR40360.1 MAG: hypothetical protein UT74_C0001G0094 [Parcubacteria group b